VQFLLQVTKITLPLVHQSGTNPPLIKNQRQMKTITIKDKLVVKSNQYGIQEQFIGSSKETHNYLLSEAKTKRRNSRIAHRLTDSVHSLPHTAHQSELVIIASFDLNSMSNEKLITLLNAHGVVKYELL
jgi:RNase P protein component